MRKKNGFIAISLIYSFFLVFLMTLSATLLNYAHNRVLVNSVVNETKDYLNDHAESDDTKLKRKNYNAKESVSYGGLTWLVLKDNSVENSVTLVLNRSLTSSEINTIITNLQFNMTFTNDRIKMCSIAMNDYYCYYTNASYYRQYNWQNSIIKTIVEEWLKMQNPLQKAITRNSLVLMPVMVNGVTDTSYIRIMDLTEGGLIGDVNTWLYTYATLSSGISYVKASNGSNVSTLTERTIRPVIQVKKN